MPSKPKVVVCVMTYNQESYIRQCLDSIVSQKTAFDFEVLVFDDCSTDGTAIICREYEVKFDFLKFIKREENIGAYRNLVEGHTQAQGEYICHCDGDDYWLPGKLQAQAEFLDKNPDYSVVWGRMNLFTDAGDYKDGVDLPFDDIFPNGDVVLEYAIRYGSPAAHSSIMYRKVARLTETCIFTIMMDYFYTLEYLSNGKGKILSNILGYYRVSSPGSISTTCNSIHQKYQSIYSKYYFSKLSKYRTSFFLYNMTNFLINIKNFRFRQSLYFLNNSIRMFSLKGVIALPHHLQQVFKLKRLCI